MVAGDDKEELFFTGELEPTSEAVLSKSNSSDKFHTAEMESKTDLVGEAADADVDYYDEEFEPERAKTAERVTTANRSQTPILQVDEEASHGVSSKALEQSGTLTLWDALPYPTVPAPVPEVRVKVPSWVQAIYGGVVQNAEADFRSVFAPATEPENTDEPWWITVAKKTEEVVTVVAQENLPAQPWWLQVAQVTEAATEIPPPVIDQKPPQKKASVSKRSSKELSPPLYGKREGSKSKLEEAMTPSFTSKRSSKDSMESVKRGSSKAKLETTGTASRIRIDPAVTTKSSDTIATCLTPVAQSVASSASTESNNTSGIKSLDKYITKRGLAVDSVFGQLPESLAGMAHSSSGVVHVHNNKPSRSGSNSSEKVPRTVPIFDYILSEAWNHEAESKANAGVSDSSVVVVGSCVAGSMACSASEPCLKQAVCVSSADSSVSACTETPKLLADVGGGDTQPEADDMSIAASLVSAYQRSTNKKQHANFNYVRCMMREKGEMNRCIKALIKQRTQNGGTDPHASKPCEEDDADPRYCLSKKVRGQCALCDRTQLLVHLRGIVPFASVARWRSERGAAFAPSDRRLEPTRAYDQVRLCVFCTQFFDADFSNYIVPLANAKILGLPADVVAQAVIAEEQEGKAHVARQKLARKPHGKGAARALLVNQSSKTLLRPLSALKLEVRINSLKLRHVVKGNLRIQAVQDQAAAAEPPGIIDQQVGGKPRRRPHKTIKRDSDRESGPCITAGDPVACGFSKNVPCSSVDAAIVKSGNKRSRPGKPAILLDNNEQEHIADSQFDANTGGSSDSKVTVAVPGVLFKGKNGVYDDLYRNGGRMVTTADAHSRVKPTKKRVLPASKFDAEKPTPSVPVNGAANRDRYVCTAPTVEMQNMPTGSSNNVNWRVQLRSAYGVPANNAKKKSSAKAKAAKLQQLAHDAKAVVSELQSSHGADGVSLPAVNVKTPPGAAKTNTESNTASPFPLYGSEKNTSDIQKLEEITQLSQALPSIHVGA